MTEEGRIDRRGHQERDADAALLVLQFQPERLGEPFDAMLRRAVGGLEGHESFREAGGIVYDRPLPLALQVWQRRLHPVELAYEDDLDLALDLLDGPLLDGRVLAGRSVVDPGVDAPEAVDRLPGRRVRELIEERGCELVYLPAYSPDYNPIEEAFAKIKNLLRKAAARTKEALVEAIGAALSAISAQDARGFFEHAGYYPTGHLL